MDGAAAACLTPEMRAALDEARGTPLNYAVRVVAAPGPEARVVVLLGEAHVKLARAARIGKRVVAAFELRGVEGFPRKRVLAGRVLMVLVVVARVLLRVATLGLVKGSTIVDARALTHGHTVPLEDPPRVPLALHVGSLYLASFFGVLFAMSALHLVGADGLAALLAPVALLFELHFPALIVAWRLRRHAWSWVLHPMIAILTARDAVMADGAARMLREHPAPRGAVLVMGRAHLPGVERILCEKYGFSRASA